MPAFRHLLPVSIVLLILTCLSADAQRRNNIWYFGIRAGLDFNSGTPVPLSDGQINSLEGTAVMSDSTTGSLLFYTDGLTVWSRRHAVMPNGTGLNAHSSTMQSSLIVPHPGSPTQYFVFTVDAINNLIGNPEQYHGVSYSIVDMTADGGFGDVTIKNRRLLPDQVAEKICGVHRCDNGTYWVITHIAEGNAFYAHAVTAAGISNPIVSNVGMVFTPTNQHLLGYLKAAPNGRRLANGTFGLRELQLFDFNPSTGIVSRPLTLTAPTGDQFWYGVAFSPNSSRLYTVQTTATGHILAQYNLDAGTAAQIEASRVILYRYPSTVIPTALQLGPNGRIYVGTNNGNYLGAINNPDLLGTSAGFTPNGVNLGIGIAKYGLPNFIDTEAGTGGPDDVTVSDDVEICAGDSTHLVAGGGRAYRWTPATGLSCTDCPSPIAFPSHTTTYRVEVSNAGGCATIDSVKVTIRPAPTISVTSATQICPGDSARLTATGGSSYRWTPTTGLSCVDCSDPIAFPNETTTYTVTVTGTNGCTAQASSVVIVRPRPDVDAGNDTTICVGQSLQLTTSNGTAWKWTPATGLSCTDCRSPVASPTSTTTYRVVVSDAGSCAASDSVTVTVRPARIVDAGPDTTICIGGSARLNGPEGAAWQWTPAVGLSCDDCRSPIASPTSTTTYRVTVTVPGLCPASDSLVVAVIPLPQIDAGSDITICAGGNARLNGKGGARYSWSPADGLSCTDCPDPIASPTSTTRYYLTGSNDIDCEATDSILVSVLEVDAGPSQTTCAGVGVRLTASDGPAWRWAPSDGLSCTDCRSPIASPKATTLYTATIIGPDGCEISDTVSVIVIRSPRVDAGNDVVICAGQPASLGASGAVGYIWSPADGLSCIACADPTASPSETTEYIVTGVSSTGCETHDTVRVIVLPSRTITARIARNLRAIPGVPISIPITLDDPDIVTAIDTLQIGIGFNRRGTIVRGATSRGTLLDGWQQETIADSAGGYAVRMIRSGNPSAKSDTLLLVELLTYVGDSLATELPLRISIPGRPCLTVDAIAGRLALDSICGLNLRLIEASATRFALPQNRPNPFNPTTEITFSIPFEGHALLRVFDMHGNEVARPVDGVMRAGEYVIHFDASTLPSGIYAYRLESAGLVRTRWMTVVK